MWSLPFYLGQFIIQNLSIYVSDFKNEILLVYVDKSLNLKTLDFYVWIFIT